MDPAISTEKEDPGSLMPTSSAAPVLFCSARPETSWASNFSPDPFILDNRLWHTVEHYFQANKFSDPAMVDKILDNPSPLKAKKAGKQDSASLPVDWDTQRLDVMERAVRAKFDQNPRLQAKLLATGTSLLIEATNDPFWGSGPDGLGQNQLGTLLMRIRDEYAHPTVSDAPSMAAESTAAVLDGKLLPSRPIHVDLAFALPCAVDFFTTYVKEPLQRIQMGLDINNPILIRVCQLMDEGLQLMTEMSNVTRSEIDAAKVIIEGRSDELEHALYFSHGKGLMTGYDTTNMSLLSIDGDAERYVTISLRPTPLDSVVTACELHCNERKISLSVTRDSHGALHFSGQRKVGQVTVGGTADMESALNWISELFPAVGRREI